MGNELQQFANLFEHLTGNPPFPWQRALYQRFVAGHFPDACDIPTGLGKTSAIAVWLIALAHAPDHMPRRLVYVVNRRTVVDQTTDEVEKYRDRITERPTLGLLKEKFGLLAISTLRGQFADNREWSADPSRPAVVVGTVDMIGSRLLFSGYGAGFRTRPLYAGLLGQDSLIIHDEAHLEPAFQRLIESIRDEQKKEPAPLGETLRLRVLEMSATPRGEGKTLRLNEEDFADPTVKQRYRAKKVLHLTPCNDAKKLADEMAALALERFADSGRAVLIFARRVEDVDKIAKRLPPAQARVLTGTMRGLERDAMVKHPLFQRFLPSSNQDPKNQPAGGTVYLVCTSAGEVGVNISADHLICDLSTFDSMAQRLGRVNRFGLRSDCEVHVFHAANLDEKTDPDGRLAATLLLLKGLDGNASPRAIAALDPQARLKAFAPPPIILSASDIILDAWTMTTIRGELPGRPKVEPYLHGIRELEPPETHIAWREEVGIDWAKAAKPVAPEDLLEDYPLKPHELLRDRSKRVFDHLSKLAIAHPDSLVWLLDDEGEIVPTNLAALAENSRLIEGRTVLLSPSSGGLRAGMLDGSSSTAHDVADEIFDGHRRRRCRVWTGDPQFDEKIRGMRLVREIHFVTNDENEDAQGKSWCWFERPAGGDTDGSRSALKPIKWEHHTNDVVRNVGRITKTLKLPSALRQAISDAAKFHDLGKKRSAWQRSIGNPDPTDWHAKSGLGWRPRDPIPYRHEFGSLFDLAEREEFKRHDLVMQDLILHLVGAHHGFARPHFPEDCASDIPAHSTADATALGTEVARRFARLQRRYGRWGLAYLESLLRAADYEASANPSGEGASDE